MRRLVRHLFTFVSALSLVLWVGVCVLWVRSYWVSDQFRRIDGKAGVDSFTTYDRSILLGRGALLYWEWAFPNTDPAYAATWERNLRAQGLIPYIRTGPYRWLQGGGTLDFAWVPTSGGGLIARVPLWSVALGFALPALPAVLSIARTVRTRHRHRKGTCPTCGYDLRVQLALSEHRESNGRASPERCPECGSV